MYGTNNQINEKKISASTVNQNLLNDAGKRRMVLVWTFHGENSSQWKSSQCFGHLVLMHVISSGAHAYTMCNYTSRPLLCCCQGTVYPIRTLVCLEGRMSYSTSGYIQCMSELVFARLSGSVCSRLCNLVRAHS